MKIPAFQIRAGDLVDLRGDPFADPKHDHALFQFELAEVVEIEQETPSCVAIGFEGFDIVGFPTDHLLDVQGHLDE